MSETRANAFLNIAVEWSPSRGEPSRLNAQ